MNFQRDCSLMAAEIVFAILSANMPNSTNLLTYATYRVCEINKNTNLFTSRDTLKPTDLLISLIDLSEILIVYNDFELVLPVLALAEHIACDIIKSSNYLLKVRISKIICLAELGLICEAMQSYLKVIRKIDLPNLFNQNSLYYDKINGKYANLQREIRFLNHLTPDNQKNVDTITNFFRLGTGDIELKYNLQANLHSELIYSRCLIIFKIFEKENYMNYLEIKPDVAFRLENLSRVEKDLREVILQLSISEEINTLSKLKKHLISNPKENNFNLTIYSNSVLSGNLINTNENFNRANKKEHANSSNNYNNNANPSASVNSNANASNNNIESSGINNIELINKRLDDISNTKKITSEEINNYYLTKNYWKEDVDLRTERFDSIIKSRLLLARIYQAQSLFLNASGIALKGLENNRKFIEYSISGIEQADDFVCTFKILFFYY